MSARTGRDDETSTGSGAGRPRQAELSRELAADLRDLAVDLSAGGYTRTTLRMLERNLLRSVPSVLAATITLRNLRSGCGVEVNLVRRIVEAGEVMSGLKVPLAALVPTLAGHTTFYASQPAAFADLVEDLATALRVPPHDLDQRVPPPSGAIRPGIEGLQDFSLVNRALGVLLNRGYELTAARTELQARAERSGTELVAAARAILASEHH